MALQEDDGVAISQVRSSHAPSPVHALQGDSRILLQLQPLQKSLGQEPTCVFLQQVSSAKHEVQGSVTPSTACCMSIPSVPQCTRSAAGCHHHLSHNTAGQLPDINNTNPITQLVSCRTSTTLVSEHSQTVTVHR